MKTFWALPAILRIALASQNAFSVHDDVLAFPQYQVSFTSDYVTEIQAQSRLAKNKPRVDNVEGDHNDILNEVAIPISGSGDLPDRSNKNKPDYEYEVLRLENHQYLCKLPHVESPTGLNETDKTLSKQDEEKELARANERGWELLQGMQGNCIYFWSGWWSYRYCFGQGVKQFHQLPPSQGVPAYPPIEDPSVEGYMLGKVEDAAKKAETGLQKGETGKENGDSTKALGTLEIRGENRYLVQRLGGGTKCDLTGKSRRIEVQFHCNPASSDRISLIKEISICAYLMVIQTPRLCNDIAFMPPQKDSPNEISCSPILSQAQIPGYESDLAADLEAAAAAAAALGDQVVNPFQEVPPKTIPRAPPMIGGIALGANKWIPKEQKIEKSAIVGGGKETYVETIADSMGKLLSPEKLKAMGLGDAKSVEKLKKELEKIAGGQGWKLEVFDTPQGREYRGVLLGDDDPSDDDKAKKEDGHVGEDNADEAQDKTQEGSEETYKDEL
ncbi:hypothetical protein MBLNU459_g3064t1 [Dothideomycetes sp. NU459]